MHSLEVLIKDYSIYLKHYYWKCCIRELDLIIQFDRGFTLKVDLSGKSELGHLILGAWSWPPKVRCKRKYLHIPKGLRLHLAKTQLVTQHPLPNKRYQQKSKKANFTKFTIFSKRFLEGIFCVPGVAYWKKEVQMTILDSIDSILLIVFISEKKIPIPPF